MAERPSETAASPAQPGAVSAAPVFEDAGALLSRLEAAVAAGATSVSRTDALALHAIAAHGARGRGVFEIAIGEGIDRILRRNGLPRLGISGIGDLAREKLGMKEAEGRRLRRNAVKLRSRPLLREAVFAGEVSPRKAELVLDGAPPGDDAYWTQRARTDTVRTLEAAMKLGPGPPEEDWQKLTLSLPAEGAKIVEDALWFAGVLLGPTSSVLQRLEVVLMEFLGEFGLPLPWWRVKKGWDASSLVGPADVEHQPGAAGAGRGAATAGAGPGAVGAEGKRDPAGGPADVEHAAGPGAPTAAAGDGSPGAGPADVEHGPIPPSAPGSAPPFIDAEAEPFDPHALVAELRELVRERETLEENLRRACLLVRRTAAWRWLPFRSFAAWCAEGLGLRPRTVRLHIAFERRLQALPLLREAFRTGRLNREQVWLVSRRATLENVEARIEEAAASTVIATRRKEDAEEQRQMWNAGLLEVSLPDRVAEMFNDAILAGQHHFPGFLPGKIFVTAAAHFALTWQWEVIRILRRTDPVIRRDGGLCRIPGCSRPAEHVHHIWFRSQGGPDEDWNCIALCAFHHLQGVHQGHVYITGRAPDDLAFLVGEVEVKRGRPSRAGSPARKEVAAARALS